MENPILNQSAKPGKHYLYEVDLEQKIAFCTVCGWTEIHVPQRSTKGSPKVFCIKRFQEKNEAYDRWANKHNPRVPDQVVRHLLSEIDIEKMTARCSVCGPTELQKLSVNNSIYYYCATNKRERMRKRRRASYVSRLSNPHALSQIDEEKKTAVCAKCGPVAIEIWMGKKLNRRCINARREKELKSVS